MSNRFDRDRQLLDDPTYLLDDGAFRSIEDAERGGDSDSAFVTDFEHEQELIEASHYLPSGQPLQSDLDQATLRRELQRREERREAPPVSIVPVSFDRGVLGANVAVVPGNPTTIAGPLSQLVHWPGDDRECIPVSVFVQPSPPFPTASGSQPLRLVANCQFGNHGGKFSFDCDVGTGTAFTLNCSSIYVSVGMEASSSRPSWDVFGSLGFYAINRTRPLTRTAYIEDLAPETTTTLVRPNFANTVEFIGRSDRAVQVTLNFQDLAGNTVVQRHLTASQYGDYIPMSNDTYLINVTNDSTTVTLDLRIIFGLGF